MSSAIDIHAHLALPPDIIPCPLEFIAVLGILGPVIGTEGGEKAIQNALTYLLQKRLLASEKASRILAFIEKSKDPVRRRDWNMSEVPRMADIQVLISALNEAYKQT